MCEGNNKKTIYFVDDEAPMRVVITKYLQKMGYETQAFSAGSDVVIACQNRLPDLLISDILMPEMNGVELIEAIRPLAPDLPVICMSGYATESTKENLIELGIINLLEKPIKYEVLKEHIENTFRNNQPKKKIVTPQISKTSLKILLVDDNEDLVDVENEFLTKCGHTVDICIDGKQVLERMVLNQYDIILLDIVLPGISGLDVLKNIKIHNRDQPVIMMTGEARGEIISDCEAITGDPCLRKPVDLLQLQKRIESFDVDEFRLIRHKNRENIRYTVVRKMQKNDRTSYEKKWKTTYSSSQKKHYPINQSKKIIPLIIILGGLIGALIGLALNKKETPTIKQPARHGSDLMDIMETGLEYLHRDETRELDNNY